MNTTKNLIAGSLLLLSVIIAAVVIARPGKQKQPAMFKAPGFAVLELFTSEGCSSCPPAEKLLSRIQEQVGNTPVYVLAYHVDYWDHQGWKDAFSDAAFSARQYDYSRQFTGQVYTPQLIVNGKAEYIGSDEAAISSAIAHALGDSATATLQLQGSLLQDKLTVSYAVAGNVRKPQLQLAIVQRNAVSHVRAGENAGRTLPHVQIVRKLVAYNLKGANAGSQSVEVPAGFNTQEWEVIGLLQDQQSGAIAAVARVNILVGK